MSNFRVSEIFESIQGEGPNIGRPSVFLRLSHCNLHCVFCDTPYTWRYTSELPHRSTQVYSPEIESQEMTVSKVCSRIESYHSTHLVITGGEPMLQQPRIVELLKMINDRTETRSVEIETAGTVVPQFGLFSSDIPVSFVVSPKLENSGNMLTQRRREPALRALRDCGAVFKFVAYSLYDFGEIEEIVELLKIPGDKVYIMPEGITPEALSEHMLMVIPEAITRGWRVTTRLQIYAWGNRRGV